jgi:C4-dicarboxylate transporter
MLFLRRSSEETDVKYVGRLISKAHSEIFCQRRKVVMRAQCVLVATTLLHSGEKFHSFLYTGSKTVHVNMESCYGGMSTRFRNLVMIYRMKPRIAY